MRDEREKTERESEWEEVKAKVATWKTCLELAAEWSTLQFTFIIKIPCYYNMKKSYALIHSRRYVVCFKLSADTAQHQIISNRLTFDYSLWVLIYGLQSIKK
jgi:hypothetical protein